MNTEQLMNLMALHYVKIIDSVTISVIVSNINELTDICDKYNIELHDIFYGERSIEGIFNIN